MELSIQSDEHYMKLALQEAERALEKDEIPVGAIVVSKGRVIARAHNLTQLLNDVTAHAEMQVITAAANNLGGKYLNKCILYVTLEPCAMCAGALYWAQLGKLVIGARDEKRGYKRLSENMLHPKTEVISDVLAEPSAELLRNFFKSKR
ncbi:MAG: nucleoside deaminase [Salibacteraceae bacterium]